MWLWVLIFINLGSSLSHYTKGFHIPAHNRWSDQFLVERLGDTEISVAITPDGWVDWRIFVLYPLRRPKSGGCDNTWRRPKTILCGTSCREDVHRRTIYPPEYVLLLTAYWTKLRTVAQMTRIIVRLLIYRARMAIFIVLERTKIQGMITNQSSPHFVQTSPETYSGQQRRWVILLPDFDYCPTHLSLKDAHRMP